MAHAEASKGELSISADCILTGQLALPPGAASGKGWERSGFVVLGTMGSSLA